MAVAGFVSAAILMPGLPKVLSPLLKKQFKQWGHFDRRRLKAELRRLQKTGVIEAVTGTSEMTYRLTEKGKIKLFKYKLGEMSLRTNHWDRKWQLVAYDIPKGMKNQAEAFRSLVKKLGFYQLQKSLWLTPYQCGEEIEFLKNLYNLQNYVTVLTISGLEGESAYKHYFGLV